MQPLELVEQLDPVILGWLHGQPSDPDTALEIANVHSVLKVALDLIDSDGGPETLGDNYCNLLLSVLWMFHEP